MLLVLWR